MSFSAQAENPMILLKKLDSLPSQGMTDEAAFAQPFPTIY